jgi:tellurite resistance protein
MATERGSTTVRHPEAKPTGRQIYALAHELCKRTGERFPVTRGAASELIERLRGQSEKGSSV